MLQALQMRSTLEPLEFLVEVTEPDKPLLVTRTQHKQILVYIALGEREKAIEAIEQGRQAAHVYLGQMALPIRRRRPWWRSRSWSRARSSWRACARRSRRWTGAARGDGAAQGARARVEELEAGARDARGAGRWRARLVSRRPSQSNLS
jgi:hypothetical protein